MMIILISEKTERLASSMKFHLPMTIKILARNQGQGLEGIEEREQSEWRDLTESIEVTELREMIEVVRDMIEETEEVAEIDNIVDQAQSIVADAVDLPETAVAMIVTSEEAKKVKTDIAIIAVTKKTADRQDIEIRERTPALVDIAPIRMTPLPVHHKCPSLLSRVVMMQS